MMLVNRITVAEYCVRMSAIHHLRESLGWGWLARDFLQLSKQRGTSNRAKIYQAKTMAVLLASLFCVLAGTAYSLDNGEIQNMTQQLNCL